MNLRYADEYFNNLKIKMMIGQILLALVLMVCVRVHILIKH